jgi:hypothetical protein
MSLIRVKIVAWISIIQGFASGLLTTLASYALLPGWDYLVEEA